MVVSRTNHSPVMVRIGVLVVILVIGGIFKLATAKPAGDERYFREAAALSRRIDRQLVFSPGNLKRQVEELPVSGVTDPKLREYHSCLLEIFSLHEQNLSEEEAVRRFMATAAKVDRLTDELNRKYVR